VSTAAIGNNVHLYPADDLAVLLVDGDRDRAYLPLDYGDVEVGSEIGVAGYPLAQVMTPNMTLSYEGLIFRVAKSVLTATYNATVNLDGGTSLLNLPLLEVNFLFVPGNSGGPVFAANTARVLGYVQGYRHQKIQERVETAVPTLVLPPGLSATYVAHQDALYSYGIKLERVRAHLETFHVSL
jgi:hypothetical protein